MIKTVKLLNPPGHGLRGHRSAVSMPLGLGILAAHLKRCNISISIHDIHADLRSRKASYRERRILRDLNEFMYFQLAKGCYLGLSDVRARDLSEKILGNIDFTSCDLVGIRINSFNQILPTLLLAEQLKHKFKKTIVVGGPFVTLYAKYFFKKYAFIDYAIVGDGEIPLERLIKHLNGELPVESVPSLYYKKKGKVHLNERKIFNIEDQLLPDYESENLEVYKQGNQELVVPYILSRGCVNRCSFCVYYKVDVVWQKKTPEKVVSDLRILKQKYGSKSFQFDDINFNIDCSYVEQVCDRIIKADLDIIWGVRIAPKNIDKRLLKKMKLAGCRALSWGIESASQNIIDSMGKGQEVEAQTKILRFAKDAGIKNNIYMMVNYPGETLDDLKKTSDFIKKNREIIDNVFIYNFTIYRDTIVDNNPDTFGLKILDNPGADLFEMRMFSASDSVRQEDQLEKARNKLKKDSLRFINYKHASVLQKIFVIFSGMRIEDLFLLILRSFYYSRYYDKVGFLNKQDVLDRIFQNYTSPGVRRFRRIGQ